MDNTKPTPLTDDAWAAAKLRWLITRSTRRVVVSLLALQFIEEDWL